VRYLLLFDTAGFLTLGSDESAVLLVAKIAVLVPYGGPAHGGSQFIHRVAVSFRRARPVNPFSANAPHFTHGTQNDLVHKNLLWLHLADAEIPFLSDPKGYPRLSHAERECLEIACQDIPRERAFLMPGYPIPSLESLQKSGAALAVHAAIHCNRLRWVLNINKRERV